MYRSSIEKEIDKFSNMASDWWKKNGDFQVLHAFNKPRINFISNALIQENIKNNAKVLDIGCGGGLLTEFFAKKGYNITGIDASFDTIEIAKKHAKDTNLEINYLHTTLEDITQTTKEKYDVILAMELLEHINSPIEFIKIMSSILNENGIAFFSTINRNIKSLILAKYSAEYILKWLPKNTHQFEKFITPKELEHMLKESSLKLIDIKGIKFNIFNQSWNIHQKPDINYICYAKKIS